MFTTRNLIVLIGKQIIIAFAAVGVALIAVYFLSREIERVSNNVATNRQLAEKLSKRTDLFSVLARDAAFVGTNDTALERAFVPADDIIEFISTLESTALKNGVTQAFNFGNPIPAAEASPFPLSTIEYQNTLSLNITSFSAYLKDFEKLPYFTRIDGLSFSSQDGAGWQSGGVASYRAVLYTKSSN